jgi:hypothetical protein
VSLFFGFFEKLGKRVETDFTPAMASRKISQHTGPNAASSSSVRRSLYIAGYRVLSHPVARRLCVV